MFQGKFLFICLLLLSLVGVCLADTASSAPLNLTEISGLNVKTRFVSADIGNKSIPTRPEQVEPWLNSLPKIETSRTPGRRALQYLDITNDSQEENWFLLIKGATIQTIDVMVLQTQPGEVQSNRTGYLHPKSLPLHYGTEFKLAPGASAKLLLLFDSEYYIAEFSITMEPVAEATSHLQQENTIIILCLGICFALGLYNLFLFFGSRGIVYLFYALSTLFFAFGWANALSFFKIFGWTPIEAILIPPFLLGSALNMFFARKFLALDKYSKSLDRAIQLIAWLSLVFIPASAILPMVGFYLVTFSTTVSLILGLVAGIYCWRAGYRPARYFILAFVAVALPNLVGNVLNLGVFSDAPVDTYLYALGGLTLDALLLAFALADKNNVVHQAHNELTSELENMVTVRTEALEAANSAMEHLIKELQQASDAKNQFLANVSHEIRTPLTSIIGYTEGMLLGDIKSKEQDRVLEIISQNGHHLLHIINDILDISKIEADKLEFEILPTSIFDVVSQVNQIMLPQAIQKNLKFQVNYEFPMPSEVNTDPTRLRQILFNLVNNAIKFTQEGEVDVSIRYQQENLLIDIRDTGIGMDEDMLMSIFNPFQQGESATTRKFGGTGLGLTISKRLAMGLGGNLEVTSKISQGSKFSVTVNAPQTKKSQLLTEQPEVANSKNFDRNHQELPTFENCKVLVVDDHPQNRDLICILLRRMGVQVTEAENGQIALELATDHQFDLVLMDIQMPVMSGIEATEQLRKLEFGLPIIALTANNMTHEIETYMRSGFTDHLAKPIVRSEFINKLCLYLNVSDRSDNLLDELDMLPIVKDYYEALRPQVTSIEKAWQDGDVAEVKEIAHRIKGAAGSFGFAHIGTMFAEVEQLIKDNQTNAIEGKLIPTIKETQTYLNISGFDIPLAICRHDMELQNFVEALEDALPELEDAIVSLQAIATPANKSVASSHISQLQKHVTKLCWSNLSEYLENLNEQLNSEAPEPELTAQLFEKMKQEVERVSTMFETNS